MHTDASKQTGNMPPRRWIRPKVVFILIGLLVIICGSVILADHFSIRDRSPASRPAVPANASGPGAAP